MECPTDLRSTSLSCIFDALFGNTLFGHIFSHMPISPYAHIWPNLYFGFSVGERNSFCMLLKIRSILFYYKKANKKILFAPISNMSATESHYAGCTSESLASILKVSREKVKAGFIIWRCTERWSI